VADAGRRDADPLLEHAQRVGRDRPRHPPADIGVVADIGREKARLAGHEDRRHDRNVRHVRAGGEIGVVAEERVALRHLGERELAPYRLDRPQQRAQMQRNMRRLRDQPPPGIEQPDRTVPPLLDVRRKRRPDQVRPHLFGNRQEPVRKHLHQDRIGEGALHRFVITLEAPVANVIFDAGGSSPRSGGGGPCEAWWRGHLIAGLRAPSGMR
jgi:hypothetical protein